MALISRIRHVAIVVRDYQRMLDFYAKILGMEILQEFEIDSEEFRKGIGIPGAKARGAHLLIPGGNCELELFQFINTMPEADECSSGADGLGYRHIAFIVEDLDATCEKLRELNIEFFSNEPIRVTHPPGVAGLRFIYFKDPEGNIIELNQLPK